MLIERIKLEDDERVLTIVRKHWWIITSQTIVVLFLALLPLGLLPLIPVLFAQFIETNTLDALLTSNQAEFVFAYSSWLLLLTITLANFWTDYYLDVWAITTKRVVLVDQRGFFRRFISSFRLERLQDMNIEVNGVLATLLDYGTIEAQTAGGSNEEFTTRFMPKPRDTKSIIVNAAEELTKEQSAHIAELRNTEGL